MLLFHEMACIWKNLTPSYVRTTQSCILFVQRRHKYKKQRHSRVKKKWAVNLPSKTPSDLALEYFDAFYKPFYGRQWPLIRVSLLSLPKYAAIINIASESETCVPHLEELGAINLIEEAVNSVCKYKTKSSNDKHTPSSQVSGSVSTQNVNHSFGESNTDVAEISLREDRKNPEGIQLSEATKSPSELSPSGDSTSPSLQTLQSDSDGHLTQVDDMKNLLTSDAVKRSADLEYFMPTEQVFSVKEELLQQEYSQGTYQERPVSVPVLPGQIPLLPKALKVMVFPSGDVSDFPKPLAEKSHLLNYYLMDAASILPVLALGISPGDNVLDLCAAPGGKSLALFQILICNGGHLVSNDISYSRMKRLKTVMRSYLPASWQEEFITIKTKNGMTFKDSIYNKVLVDAPCNSDRHVLREDDNNLFKPGRINDRLEMTTLQKDLLLAGIRSCKPGGTVVYSTCTLAAVQNDGVIQAALEELWETSNIDVVVEDLSPVRMLFGSFFKFHSGTKFGLQVLPSLLNNYGPMYCCKLRRLQ